MIKMKAYTNHDTINNRLVLITETEDLNGQPIHTVRVVKTVHTMKDRRKDLKGSYGHKVSYIRLCDID